MLGSLNPAIPQKAACLKGFARGNAGQNEVFPAYSG
jgi:hypothetical protein